MSTIFIAGDSTAQYNDYRTYPQLGWGQVIHQFLDPSNLVKNFARNGRSTKTFIEEKRLEGIEKLIKKGDYLFIQFAHNDGNLSDLNRYTDPHKEYQEKLKIYIETAQKHGAYPILLTSVVRRLFDENGEIPKDVLGEYTDAMRKVAKETSTPIIDIFEKSRKAIMKLGDKESEKLYMFFSPNMFKNYPEGKDDNTHLRYDGAMLIASLVWEGLNELGEPYSWLVLKPDSEI